MSANNTFGTVGSWPAAQRSPTRRLGKPTESPLCLESLEERRLFSFSFSNGVLGIEGTQNSDVSDVRMSNWGTPDDLSDDRVVASLDRQDGSSESISIRLWDRISLPGPFGAPREYVYQRRVTQIVFNGGDGDDAFVNQTDIRTHAHGGQGDDSLTGGGGDDSLYGNGDDDVLRGGAGADLLWGDDDILRADAGNDHLYGDGGDDYLYGFSGNDYLDGGSQNDHLYGGTGRDSLYGRDGDDYLHGGVDRVRDELWGGNGFDTFRNDWWSDARIGLNLDQPMDRQAGEPIVNE
jgi:Ca2+-binding RTX toxin-like protein